MADERLLMRCFVDAGANVKQRIKAFLAGGVLALALFGAAMAGPLEDGQAAYGRGDYATAMRLLRPLAEQGNTEAQIGVAAMYDAGRGVPQDYGQEVAWLRKAADHGEALAQIGLGTMYAKGEGVPQDYVQAHMWFNLAASVQRERNSPVKNRMREGALDAKFAIQLSKAGTTWPPR